jgi:hypothetical protein
MTLPSPLFATSAVRLGWLGLSACLYGLLGYTTPRSQFSMLIGLYALLMWGYSLRIRPILGDMNNASAQPDYFLFGAAALFRMLLLLAMPALSEDYARFVWDGQLLIHGINPFRYLPAELMAGGAVSASFVDPALYQSLNSPNYYTVYPPFGQSMFALAAWLSPGNLLGNVVVLRLPIILADLGTLWLLPKLLKQNGRNQNLALLYGLNPLIILELTGNVHFEALMIFFTLLALYFWRKEKLILSAGALALAIATKLLPLITLPLLVAWAGWKLGVRYTLYTLGFVGLLFIPFFDLTLLMNMLQSIDLYFRKFEFNASLYYLIREAGYWLLGYNIQEWIGWLLPILTTIGLSKLAFARRYSPAVRLTWMLTLYLAMATNIHPWYIAPLVAASAFALSPAYSMRYVLVWSGLIWLSYSAYRSSPVREEPALLGLEYGLVAALFLIDTRHYLTNHQIHA